MIRRAFLKSAGAAIALFRVAQKPAEVIPPNKSVWAEVQLGNDYQWIVTRTFPTKEAMRAHRLPPGTLKGKE